PRYAHLSLHDALPICRPAVAVVRFGAAVHAQDQRVALVLLLVERMNEDAFELETVARFPLHDFLFGELHVLRPRIGIRAALRPRDRKSTRLNSSHGST